MKSQLNFRSASVCACACVCLCVCVDHRSYNAHMTGQLSVGDGESTTVFLCNDKLVLDFSLFLIGLN